MRITRKALNQVKNTVGRKPPETGGILISDKDDDLIIEFCFDDRGCSARDHYEPDARGLTRKLRQRTKRGCRLAGFVHSHPGTCCPRLSDQDVVYARKILATNPGLDAVWMVIVDDNGYHPWKVRAQGRPEKDTLVVVGRPRK